MKPEHAPRVLVLDDEPDIRELLELTLRKMELDVVCAATLADARRRLQTQRFDLALTDMRLPDGEGMELVQYIAQHNLDVPIAVITAYGSTEGAVAAMKAGAFDYLQKPVSLAQLRSLVRSALALADTPALPVERLAGESAAMAEVRATLDKLARTQASVHICGESGSGKEQAARRIHEQGPRAGRPFVAVNCGAIPETLMESEFFGYKKGAFTSADAERDGFFQQANGGTLFLDEVAELPLAMQVKLLRVLQDRRVRKLGGGAEEPVDVRLISATHQDLAACVAAGHFRQDLFYRIHVVRLQMPPLRELRDDLPHFIAALLARHAGNGPVPVLQPDARAALLAYHYPGNFRELENILERALALADGASISVADLQLSPGGGAESEHIAGEALQDYLDRVERDAITRALEATHYNRTQAARLLGVSFRSLRYRLERLGIK